MVVVLFSLKKQKQKGVSWIGKIWNENKVDEDKIIKLPYWKLIADTEAEL